MTMHLPAADAKFAEATTPFEQWERAMLFAALREEAGRWCRQTVTLRTPNLSEDDPFDPDNV
ncbi:hypothetical protein [Alicyclobacillus dauci]|uniref:Uncharacterized protein n=1 Tax=Alicyclobacillus dauci TaxID=1475485 RepID=A0ABY6YY23_9BACL|nr:hypothetical protein [Alicyclobacillus dauci]WAH35148.1 hypothetical protein NZD86_12560 [Alicyclobacillus dauci]